MWIVALEALVALSLLLLIVWLTMGSSRRRDADDRSQDKANQPQDKANQPNDSNNQG